MLDRIGNPNPNTLPAMLVPRAQQLVQRHAARSAIPVIARPSRASVTHLCLRRPSPHSVAFQSTSNFSSGHNPSQAATQQQQQPSPLQSKQHLRSPTEPLGTEQGPRFDDGSNQPSNAGKHEHATVPASSSGRTRVVVLGTGWASYCFVRAIDRRKFEVSVVSPRNHFLFTPLLPGTTTGTLEYRSIIEPIRKVPDITFHEAYADDIDFDQQRVCVRSAFDGSEFDLHYDQLVIGVGSHNATFNVPGVREYANFLKNVRDAQAIRNKILSRLEQATSPLIDEQQRRNLLRVITVGGGPTSVEFAAELYDFIAGDGKRAFPTVAHLMEINVVEATDHLLSAFDKKLSGYVTDLYRKRPGMKVLTGTSVKEVKDTSVIFSNGDEVKCGCVVWSTGLAANPLIKRLPLLHQNRSQRLEVNEHLQVQRANKTGEGKDAREVSAAIVPNVYAFGDCAVIPIKSHPATAQVAAAEASYLAKRFNKYELSTDQSNSDALNQSIPKFQYRSFGQLACKCRSVHLHISILGAVTAADTFVLLLIAHRHRWQTSFGRLANRRCWQVDGLLCLRLLALCLRHQDHVVEEPSDGGHQLADRSALRPRHCEVLKLQPDDQTLSTEDAPCASSQLEVHAHGCQQLGEALDSMLAVMVVID